MEKYWSQGIGREDATAPPFIWLTVQGEQEWETCTLMVWGPTVYDAWLPLTKSNLAVLTEKTENRACMQRREGMGMDLGNTALVSRTDRLYNLPLFGRASSALPDRSQVG